MTECILFDNTVQFDTFVQGFGSAIQYPTTKRVP